MEIIRKIKNYNPVNEQEKCDKELILDFYDKYSEKSFLSVAAE
jgi:hypothetical protein